MILSSYISSVEVENNLIFSTKITAIPVFELDR